MAEVLPQKDPDIIHAEQVSIGAAAEKLAATEAVIPQNTGDIVIVVPSGDHLHWLASETPTTSLGNRITLGHPGRIPHSLQKRAKFISGDGSDVAAILIYYRGAGKQTDPSSTGSGTISEPF
jgi:hypothetical protein